MELRFTFSVVISSVVKPVGVVVVEGAKPSVVNCEEESVVELNSGCLVAVEVEVIGFVVEVLLTVSGRAVVVLVVVEVVLEVVGLAITIGFCGGDMMTVVLFIIALTLDVTETSISSKVTFSPEGSGIEIEMNFSYCLRI